MSSDTEAGVHIGDEQLAALSQKSDGELDRILDVLRARIEEEFRLAERLDLKARQVFALAVAAFAGAQAAAYADLANGALLSGEKVVILVVALVAAIALGALTLLVHNYERLRRETDLRPMDILERSVTDTAQNLVSARLIVTLSEIAQSRSVGNDQRAGECRMLARSVRYALLLYIVELGLALAVRA